jgi:hypothetical protein
VLTGTGGSLTTAFQAATAADAFRRVFLAAAASQTVALIAIILMEERPLQTGGERERD